MTEDVQTFRLTFGQRYRDEAHPTFPEAHPDGWVEIPAADWKAARDLANRIIGRQWSHLYSEEEWPADAAQTFPRGCIATVTP